MHPDDRRGKNSRMSPSQRATLGRRAAQPAPPRLPTGLRATADPAVVERTECPIHPQVASPCEAAGAVGRSPPRTTASGGVVLVLDQVSLMGGRRPPGFEWARASPPGAAGRRGPIGSKSVDRGRVRAGSGPAVAGPRRAFSPMLRPHGGANVRECPPQQRAAVAGTRRPSSDASQPSKMPNSASS